jgi:hypothetical protein
MVLDLIRPGSAFLIILVSQPVYITHAITHSVFRNTAPRNNSYF